MTIGERIKELRKNKNISQDQFADDINVSRQSVSNWEKDIVSPDIESVKMICDYFNISMDYLITGKEDNKKTVKWKLIILKMIPLFVFLLVIVGAIISLNVRSKNSTDYSTSTINFTIEGIIILISSIIIVIIGIIYLVQYIFTKAQSKDKM